MAFGVFIHRTDSIYDDVPSERYQFPKQYLTRAQQCVGDWIVYLEPSKVKDTKGYFAQSPREDDVSDADWRDEDIIAVQKVFSAVSFETKKASGNLQVILLDHADEKVWGDIDNVMLIEEWRGGKKLVPPEWL